MSAKRLVTAIRAPLGATEIWYLEPTGLRGGHYLITLTSPSLRPLVSQRVTLSDLIILRDHLTEEIERAATLGG